MYCLALDQIIQLDSYLTNYCSVQNNVWIRRCDMFRREIVPATLNEEQVQILFGTCQNKNKIWQIPGLLRNLGYIMRFSDLKAALPRNSICVVVSTFTNGKFTSYTVQITRIGGYQEGTEEYAQLLIQCGLHPRLCSSSSRYLNVGEVFLRK